MTHQPIPLFDVKAQYERLRSEIDEGVQRVLSHGGYILGTEVRTLEAALSARLGGTQTVSVGNGTDALLVALLSEGIGPGDAVFVPAFTFIATAGAVVSAGAVPVFCDVDPETFCLDPRDLARQIDGLAEGLTPRAVIPVDLFGQPADYPAIAEVSAAHSLLVIADAAQSMGAALNGAPVGDLAPVTATSFYPTKPLGGFGDGGAVFTRDTERADRMRLIRTHGGEQIDGMNSRLDTLQAAILLEKLKIFDDDRQRRAQIAAMYDEALAPHLRLQICPAGAESARAVYAVITDKRDALQAALTEAGIATRAYYSTPLHLTNAMRRFSGGPGTLPVTEHLGPRILAIPIFAELSEADVARVTDTVIAAVSA